MNNEKAGDIDQLMAQVRKDIEGGADPAAAKTQHVVYGGLPLAEIIGRVRAEVARRRAASAGHAAVEDVSFDDVTPEQARALFPQWSPVAARVADKQEYALGELLSYSDEDFIRTMYRVILRRTPDSNGVRHYLSELRSGQASKVDIIGEIRFSPEGRSRGVHIDGLLIPYTIGKWKRKRFIGRILRWLHAFARLDSQASRQSMQVADLAHEIHAMGGVFNRLSDMLVQWQDAVHKQIESHPSAGDFQSLRDKVQENQKGQAKSLHEMMQMLEQNLREQRASLTDDMAQGLEDAAKNARESMDKAFDALASVRERVEQVAETFRDEQARTKELVDKVVVSDAALVSQQKEFLTVQQRLAHIERLAIEYQQQVRSGAMVDELRSLSDRLMAVKASFERRLTSMENRHGIANTDVADAALDLDPFYAAFEDRFRGDRMLVRRRAEPYLDLIREVGAGSSGAPVLDIGCGRGEWLELLRDHGLTARGIDLNRVFADICRGYGLDIMEGDAIKILDAIPSNSIGAITSMHLVEHLPFERMIQLIDEAHRVLRPGGIVILETPNPENPSVGSHTFYMDPTHRNPLPPEALRWIVTARGFHFTRIERLTAARDIAVPELIPEDAPGAASINAVLSAFGTAPDYAVIARKP